MNIRTKFCGITRPEDARAAADLGVDAIGLVFFSGSKRSISVAQAQQIVLALPPFVNTVALFVNENADNIREILTRVPIDTLQFHGDETPEFCQQFQRPFLKAIRVQCMNDIQTACRDFSASRALLLDAFVANAYGGTGHMFDWTILPKKMPHSWILSGGLTTENITNALQQTGATAVDVSSGVESAPGIKSLTKMTAFLTAIRVFQAA